jgi:hypothetical protein
MPFSDEFNNVYTYAIKGACNNLGVYCERVDEQVYEGTVLERIYNQIAKSDVIVGDMRLAWNSIVRMSRSQMVL